jgi:hypothetical protein
VTTLSTKGFFPRARLRRAGPDGNTRDLRRHAARALRHHSAAPAGEDSPDVIPACPQEAPSQRRKRRSPVMGKRTTPQYPAGSSSACRLAPKGANEILNQAGAGITHGQSAWLARPELPGAIPSPAGRRWAAAASCVAAMNDMAEAYGLRTERVAWPAGKARASFDYRIGTRGDALVMAPYGCMGQAGLTRIVIPALRAIHLTGGVLVIRSPGPSSWGPFHARRPAAGRRRCRRRP